MSSNDIGLLKCLQFVEEDTHCHSLTSLQKKKCSHTTCTSDAMTRGMEGCLSTIIWLFVFHSLAEQWAARSIHRNTEEGLTCTSLGTSNITVTWPSTFNHRWKSCISVRSSESLATFTTRCNNLSVLLQSPMGVSRLSSAIRVPPSWLLSLVIRNSVISCLVTGTTNWSSATKMSTASISTAYIFSHVLTSIVAFATSSIPNSSWRTCKKDIWLYFQSVNIILTFFFSYKAQTKSHITSVLVYFCIFSTMIFPHKHTHSAFLPYP